jgi:hypothetical protein
MLFVWFSRKKARKSMSRNRYIYLYILVNSLNKSNLILYKYLIIWRKYSFNSNNSIV